MATTPETQRKIRFDVITLFPEMIAAATAASVIGRATERGLIDVQLHQLRDYTGGSPHPIDDAPYGGGPGQVMRVEPIYAAVEQIAGLRPDCRRILLSPQGRPFTQAVAREFAACDALLMFCGRYEGVDERARGLFDEEISIGDYVLAGGEVAALAIIEAVGRLIPGVLGSAASTTEESFSEGTLEYPHYTRPDEFRGLRVPPVLLSGNHAAIAAWRREQALERTRRRRPDLLTKGAPKTGGGDREDD